MTLKLQTGISIESLNMSIAVLKATSSDYALRAKQAEEMVGVLMAKNVPAQMQQDIFRLVAQHVDQRSLNNATHAHAIIEAAALSLTSAIKSLKAHADELPKDANGVSHPVNTLGKAMQLMLSLQADLERFLNPNASHGANQPEQSH